MSRRNVVTVMSDQHSPRYAGHAAHLKYVEYVGYAPELFDLDADPDERFNLAGDPKHAADLDRLAERLRERLDPAATDALAKQDQKDLIEKFGGPEKAATTGAPSYTPVPTG